VFFVTDDEKALAAAASGKRTAGLLIDYETAKQRGWKPPPLPLRSTKTTRDQASGQQ
jgi:hypothetical protein